MTPYARKALRDQYQQQQQEEESQQRQQQQESGVSVIESAKESAVTRSGIYSISKVSQAGSIVISEILCIICREQSVE